MRIKILVMDRLSEIVRVVVLVLQLQSSLLRISIILLRRCILPVVVLFVKRWSMRRLIRNLLVLLIRRRPAVIR